MTDAPLASRKAPPLSSCV